MWQMPCAMQRTKVDIKGLQRTSKEFQVSFKSTSKLLKFLRSFENDNLARLVGLIASKRSLYFIMCFGAFMAFITKALKAETTMATAQKAVKYYKETSDNVTNSCIIFYVLYCAAVVSLNNEAPCSASYT